MHVYSKTSKGLEYGDGDYVRQLAAIGAARTHTLNRIIFALFFVHIPYPI